MTNTLPTDPTTWTLDDLKTALQFAVELELSTLPPYLIGMWSAQNQTGQVATLICSVVREEMLHMGLACNMLTAIGGIPIIDATTMPTYPGNLPGGVLPALNVYLGGLTKDYVKDVYMNIEYPEGGPVDPQDRSGTAEQGPTIGQFYDAILTAFNTLKPTITATNQITTHVGLSSVFAIQSLDDVARAIQEITEQGEGTEQSSPDALDEMDELAHYYRFGEIYYEKELEKNDSGIWGYTGNTVPFPTGDGAEGVYTILPIPANGYQNAPANVQPALTAFNQAFSSLISQLQKAWQTGDPNQLGSAVNTMFSLQPLANAIMQFSFSGGGVYGPEFLLVPPPPPTPPATGGVGVPTFNANIALIFAPYVEVMKQNGYDLSSYSVVSNKENLPIIWTQISTKAMPCTGATPLTAAQIETFKAWMDGGTPES